MLRAGVVPLIALLSGCTATPRVPSAFAPQEVYWASLQTICGRAFAGRLVEGNASDSSFRTAELRMHVRSCTPGEIRIPFHVGENRSRTWVITRIPGGFRLKHDHRHEDGSEDPITQYGGDTRGGGTATRQDFHADSLTARLIPAARTNIWTVEIIPGDRFAYALRREGTDRRFRVEFDLTKPISAARPQDQPSCPRGQLPAYAHNDYRNRRPLYEALERGFRGVEVDLFLVDGLLRVGHDRREARKVGTFEALYLAPLDSVVARCGRLTVDSHPFLLAIELKERSRAAYDSLVQLLRRYDRVYADRSTKPKSAIEIVLVGWLPPDDDRGSGADGPLPIQFRLTTHKAETLKDPRGRVRLISVDYGKTIGPSWSSARVRREWLASLRSIKASSPGRLLRVHNVPPDAMLYAVLFDAGVDLIGVGNLATAANLFVRAKRDAAANPTHATKQ